MSESKKPAVGAHYRQRGGKAAEKRTQTEYKMNIWRPTGPARDKLVPRASNEQGHTGPINRYSNWNT